MLSSSLFHLGGASVQCTLLSVEARPSGEVVPTKGRPCLASVAAEVEAFSGIHGLWQAMFVFNR